LTGLRITASGTANDLADVDGVHLYADVNGNGLLESGVDVFLAGPVAFSADNGVAVFSGLARTIAPAGVETWLVLADFDAAAVMSRTFRAAVAAASDVTVTGGPPAPVVTGPPCTGQYMSIGIVGTLDLAAGPFSPPAGDLPAGAALAPMLDLSLAAGSLEGVRVRGLTVTAAGTLDTSKITVWLHADANGDGRFDSGDEVLAGPGIFAGATVEFPGLDRVIPAGATAAWFLSVDADADAPVGATVSLSVALASDVPADGVLSGKPAWVSGAPVSGGEMTVAAAAPAAGAGDFRHWDGWCGGGPGGSPYPGAVFGLTFLLFAGILALRSARRARGSP
jgi:hypothetical protein